MRLLRVVFCVLAFAGMTYQGLRAQEVRSGRGVRVPATIIQIEELPRPDAPFLIVRHPAGAADDVIVLPAGADAAILSQAVHALLIARRRGGDRADVAAVLRVRSTSADRIETILPWTPRVIQDLQRAPPRRIPGIGSGPAVQIWLPRQRPDLQRP